MRSLIVSMVRFSTALTLYGIEQVQATLGAAQGGQEVSKAVDKLEDAIDSLTEAFSTGMDRSKQETLNSISEVTEQIVSRSLSLMDPREFFKPSTDSDRKSSGDNADWITEGTSTTESAPIPAADLLQ